MLRYCHQWLCLIFITLVFIPSANANSELAAQISQLESNHERLTRYIKHPAKVSGEQRLLNRLRVKQIVDEQALQMNELLNDEDALAALSPEQLDTIKDILEEQATASVDALIELDRHISDERASRTTDDSNKLLDWELQMAQLQQRLDAMLSFSMQNITWQDQVGLPTSSDRTLFTKGLIERADDISLLLVYSEQQLAELTAEKSEALESEQERLDTAIRAYKQKIDSNNSSLELTVKLLDQLGANTSKYKEVLIASTGSVTEDIFNINVVSRLLSRWSSKLWAGVLEYGPDLLFKLLLIVAILAAFSFAAKTARKLVLKATSNSKLNLSALLKDFFASIVHKIIMLFGILVALGQAGIEVGPLLAGFGMAGIVIGFALQGTLSNFASGLMILIYRPFDVNDMVKAGGVTGTVEKLSLVNATIKTIDNQRIIVPNNKIWEDVITNVTAERVRRVDLVFGIGYKDDIAKAEQVITSVVKAHEHVLKHPEPVIKLANLGESSVDFWVRPWVRTENYWDVYWDLTRQIKLKFDEEGINIPFPQRDVHIYHTHTSADEPEQLSEPK
ncbi:mechanosensitive ion channel [Neiella sp. HB171785]|uniref:Small-conductance mechanosensitive channel n=1 Tax=Neiella litorisoli TaxID=2771431 RepID=A0A8J6QVF4_9GAMM|nr:mechanosensitive ion channel domain-containing protein [Neiella litorisoli]MBD1390418.1 mechanosensitive ion channel [Neiella litorisoli]